jgi:hypothetical protein
MRTANGERRTANADRPTGAGGGVVVLGILGKGPLILRTDIARRAIARSVPVPTHRSVPTRYR